MADNSEQQNHPAEPRGFGEHSRGLAGEYAHEQGWGLNVPQRQHETSKPQDVDGGTEYNYGARDFGGAPINTALEPGAGGPTQNKK